MARRRLLGFALLASWTISACGSGETQPQPQPTPDVPERLVVMGLHSLGRATSIDLERPSGDHERRQLPFACGDAIFQFVRSGVG